MLTDVTKANIRANMPNSARGPIHSNRSYGSGGGLSEVSTVPSVGGGGWSSRSSGGGSSGRSGGGGAPQHISASSPTSGGAAAVLRRSASSDIERRREHLFAGNSVNSPSVNLGNNPLSSNGVEVISSRGRVGSNHDSPSRNQGFPSTGMEYAGISSTPLSSARQRSNSQRSNYSNSVSPERGHNYQPSYAHRSGSSDYLRDTSVHGGCQPGNAIFLGSSPNTSASPARRSHHPIDSPTVNRYNSSDKYYGEGFLGGRTAHPSKPGYDHSNKQIAGGAQDRAAAVFGSQGHMSQSRDHSHPRRTGVGQPARA